MSSKSLYIHVPFCKGICGYCDFKRVLYNNDLVEKWLDRIVKDIKQIRQKQFETIYIGGGTPSSLNETQLERLLKSLEDIKAEKEFTIEANPESVTEEKIRLFKKYGVNRISLGVQSFQERILHILERASRPAQIYKVIDLLNRNGLNNISIDLMYSLPGQTLDDWKKTLEIAANLPIKHISLYSLTIEEGSRFYKEGKKPLDNDLEFEMYEYAIEYLQENGYEQYEISNFAKKGYQSNHNKTYWHYDDFMAIGLGAAGKEEGVRYTYQGELEDYLIGKEEKEEIVLSKEDMAFEAIMMGLRLNEGIKIEEYDAKYGMRMQDIYQDALKKNLALGNLIIEDGYLKATSKGRYILNDVLEDFL